MNYIKNIKKKNPQYPNLRGFTQEVFLSLEHLPPALRCACMSECVGSRGLSEEAHRFYILSLGLKAPESPRQDKGKTSWGI